MSEPRPSILRRFGPAFVVACIVLGPGSVFTSSKVGARFGYDMIWVLACATVLMIAMVALGTRLGACLNRSPCEELAARLGRPVALLIGVSLFLIASCFQFGNNTAVLAAIELMLNDASITATNGGNFALAAGVVIALNGGLVVLFGATNVYQIVERAMMLLVGLMIAGFAGNAFFAAPSPAAIVGGLVPSLPTDVAGGVNTSGLFALMGLFATTFSVAGAFYQAYLVREKGWTSEQLRIGMVDSVAGILVLSMITLLIMSTAAAVLRGAELASVTDVARQLEPLFGPAARWLFALGLFAAAFSSLLTNAMAGGTVLADGLGQGGRLKDGWPARWTAVGLVLGMTVAIIVRGYDWDPVNLIVFAQAVTVLGVPAIAVAMLYLGLRGDGLREQPLPTWVLVMSGIGTLATFALAYRTVHLLMDRVS